MIMAEREGVGLNRLQLTTRMSTSLALQPGYHQAVVAFHNNKVVVPCHNNEAVVSCHKTTSDHHAHEIEIYVSHSRAP